MRNSVKAGDPPPGQPPNGEGRLGVLFEPGNVEELIAGMRFLIDAPEWRRVLGENARREAIAKYTWDQHVAKIEERIVDLAGTRLA
jgi:glycosyltransferase involved in cell wall biosynthesis